VKDRTASRPLLTTTVAIEAALVEAADKAASRIVLLRDTTGCQQQCVDGNPHIRAEARGVWSPAGS